MTKRSKSNSAEQVAGITDILWEILLRLPPKSLLRFSSVSKHWLSQISNPHFRHLHTTLHHHHTPPSLLHHTPSPSSSSSIIIPLTTTNSTARFLNLAFLNRRHVTVIRSCNGLLLCHAGGPTYFVCNPTTNSFHPLTLPKQQPLLWNQTRSVYLAFDPLKSPNFHVVSIHMTNTGSFTGLCKCEFNVYSSKTGLWSDPAAFFTAQSKVVTAAGVYCNGAIHWSNDGEISVYFDVCTRCLKSFKMPLDDMQWGRRMVEYFGESKGKLHLILGKIEQGLEFEVFEMKEDYSFWSLKHSVDLSYARIVFPELSWDLARFVLPFYVVWGAKEGSSMMLVLLVGGTAICYDPVCCALRKLCDFKPDMAMVDVVAGYLSGEVFQYFESLSPVGRDW